MLPVWRQRTSWSSLYLCIRIAGLLSAGPAPHSADSALLAAWLVPQERSAGLLYASGSSPLPSAGYPVTNQPG